MRASLPGLLGLLCTAVSLLLVGQAQGAPPSPTVVPYAVERFSEAQLATQGRLDLNTASAKALQGLPGIGPATSAAILADRQARGPFRTVEALQRVKGIGPAKLAAVRPFVTVGPDKEGAAGGVESAAGR